MRYFQRLSAVLGLLLTTSLILAGCARPPRTDFPRPPDLTPLADKGMWRYPAWSPTGSEIAFLYDSGSSSALLCADVATGRVVTLVGESKVLMTVAPAGFWSVSRYPQGPAWSPQGDRIAFMYEESGRMVGTYVVDRDGSVLTRLSDGWGPAWSPDGEWLAFWRAGEGIYIGHPDGTSEEQLTHGDDYGPLWSPDGTRIVFISERDGNREIYMVNADGSGESNLTWNPADDCEPAWSPDGSRIAFRSDRDGDLGIYTMAPDGSGQVAVTKDGGFSPTWSPDGRRIAFHDRGDLYVMDSEGGNRRLLASLASCACTEFSWSPDGQRIAFLCAYPDPEGNPDQMTGSQIYLVRVGP